MSLCNSFIFHETKKRLQCNKHIMMIQAFLKIQRSDEKFTYNINFDSILGPERHRQKR